jgi:hypothetical protein
MRRTTDSSPYDELEVMQCRGEQRERMQLLHRYNVARTCAFTRRRRFSCRCVRRVGVGFLREAMRCKAKKARSSSGGVSAVLPQSCLSSPKENYPVNERVLFIHDGMDEEDNSKRAPCCANATPRTLSPHWPHKKPRAA